MLAQMFQSTASPLCENLLLHVFLILPIEIVNVTKIVLDFWGRPTASFSIITDNYISLGDPVKSDWP